MKRPLLLKLFILMACLMPSLSAVAAEAYACYTSSNTTLTFYYDNYRSSRTGTTYDLNSDDNSPGWYSDETSYNDNITRVVFNASFANARPTTTHLWFFEAANLTSITGLNYLNTSEVTNMSAMFQGCRGLTSLNLSSFNTAKVTEMRSMFNGCSGLTSLNLSGFDTANVTDMGWMFDSCTGLTSLDLSSFKTYNVTNMGWMFAFCTGLTSLNLSGFQTDDVTDMSGMFAFCTGLTSLDVSNFDTYFVEDMHAMFGLCSSLTSLDLSSFNTRWVTNMQDMFNGGTNLNTIYVGSDWSTAAVNESDNMFKNCTNLVGGKGTTYDDSHVDATYAHIDGGPSNPGYLRLKIETYAVYTPSNTTLTFYHDSERSTRPGTTYDMNEGTANPGWFTDNSYKSITKVVFDDSFSNARPKSTCVWFGRMTNLTSISGIRNLNTSQVEIMNYMFYGCSGLSSIDLTGFNTDKVTSMEYMFFNCTNLSALDLSSFNTASVTNMNYMFRGCSKLTTIYVSEEWSTDAVTSSSYMFTGCTKLVGGMGTTYDASHVNAAYAHIDGGPSNPGYLTPCIEPYVVYLPENTTMSFYYDNQRFYRPGMTYSMHHPIIDIFPGWEEEDWTTSVTQVVFDPSFADYEPGITCFWLGGMSSLQTITGMEYLNTSHVYDMYYMFSGCSSLTSLDLSSFNTEKVDDMQGMFNGCTNLNTIYVGSGWSTDAVTHSNYMFSGCTNLVGGMGTTYDANHVDATYAHIDGGPSNPGYFSLFIRGDVNADGVVNIADVTALIDYLLSGAVAPAAADCNVDGVLNIADVTTLIDFLLSTPDYYIVGNDPFGNWDPAAGVKMTRNADGSYSYNATINGSVWFVFASKLSSSWETFNSDYRFGPSGGRDETVQVDTWVNTQRQNNSNGAYRFNGSGDQYVFTFIPSPGISPTTGKFKIEGTVVIPPIETYTVAGEPASVFGTEWDPYNSSNDMTLNSSGVYELIKNNCLLEAGSSVLFKVVGNHYWGYAWPDENCSLNIDTTGYYNLKFTFDPNTYACSIQKL